MNVETVYLNKEIADKYNIPFYKLTLEIEEGEGKFQNSSERILALKDEYGVSEEDLLELVSSGHFHTIDKED